LKKNKPRRWVADPMAMYTALDRVTPVTHCVSENLHMRITSHDAMDALCKGKATNDHLKVISNVSNMAETLAVLYGIKKDWLPEIAAAQTSLKALAERGARIGRYVLKAEELNALNLLIQINDSQLDACSVHTLGEASQFISNQLAAGKSITLPTIKAAA